MTSVVVVDPASGAAQACLTAYFSELARRFSEGFDPGDDDLDAFRPPRGVFLVAVEEGVPVACGALQDLGPGITEIKRMWVDPGARGRGLGGLVLRSLEEQARQRGRPVVRLDTNEVLTDALGMYAGAGYTPVERYNDNPYAHHWFEKAVGPGGPSPHP